MENTNLVALLLAALLSSPAPLENPADLPDWRAPPACRPAGMSSEPPPLRAGYPTPGAMRQPRAAALHEAPATCPRRPAQTP